MKLRSLATMTFLLSLSPVPVFIHSAFAADTGGFATADGGDNARAVTVKNLAELRTAFNAHRHHIIIDGTIHGGPEISTFTFATTDWNNTTIEGAPGGKATLENVQLKFDGELLPSGTNIENIKIANLNFHGNISELQSLPKQVYGTSNNAGINYLGVSLRRITNAHITHCAFFDISDDLMSVTRNSDDVTIDYSHFYFTNKWVNMRPDPVWNWVGEDTDLAGERLAMVVGANSSDSYMGTRRLHVTLHHNWFGPNVRGRPLLRGWVHAYSNYFDNRNAPSGSITGEDGRSYPKSQYTALQLSSGGVLYSEQNYFYRTHNSNSVSVDSSGYGYRFYERNNTYSHTTGSTYRGSSFSGEPGNYYYAVTSVNYVPSFVRANAGPQ